MQQALHAGSLSTCGAPSRLPGNIGTVEILITILFSVGGWVGGWGREIQPTRPPHKLLAQVVLVQVEKTESILAQVAPCAGYCTQACFPPGLPSHHLAPRLIPFDVTNMPPGCINEE